ncbi:class I SAM-dependent methyltransferase [Nocardioides ungokensis]|uniref:class I SAM-dependent methyltransferase n=1 Tax=Nocardioides ungokensis TaxID=1643322 RepID=UPI0015DF4D25|nr:class I SAM-dependent methyltransferase [Nocardioides ungokensis]
MTVELTSSDEGLRDDSFSAVFSRALRGRPCTVVGVGTGPEPLPVASWVRTADDTDTAMLAHCVGPTLDIGCGPGRLTARLAELGHVVLGIDVVHEAVRQTRQRGVSAIVRDVFEMLPGEGRWHTALLADGNVGIGGDPVALLARVRQLLDPRGRVVVELSPPGVGLCTMWAELHCDGLRSRPFRWSLLGVDGVAEVAAAAGLAVLGTHCCADRWFAVLEGDR